jgi:hypothetical protein
LTRFGSTPSRRISRFLMPSHATHASA